MPRSLSLGVVEACKWVDEIVLEAPYVTSLAGMPAGRRHYLSIDRSLQRPIAYHSCERVPSAICRLPQYWTSTRSIIASTERIFRPTRMASTPSKRSRLRASSGMLVCVRALDCPSEHHRCEYLADTMLIASIGTRRWQFDQAHRWRIHHGHSWTHAGHDQGALPNRSLREQPTGASQCMVPITNASADSLLD